MEEVRRLLGKPANRELGWEPRPLEEGLPPTVQQVLQEVS